MAKNDYKTPHTAKNN